MNWMLAILMEYKKISVQRTSKMEAGRLAIWMQVTAAVDVIWNKELAKAQEQDVLPGYQPCEAFWYRKLGAVPPSFAIL